MNPFVSLTFDFAIDARAMCDGIASVECAHELGGIVERDGNEAGVGELANCLIRGVASACDEHNGVPFRRQCTSDVAADETGASSDGDFHK
jgi:hypothetical protein